MSGEEPGRSLRELLERGSVVVPLVVPALEDALAALWTASESGRDDAAVPSGLREVRPSDLVSLGEHAVLAHLHEDGTSEVRVSLGVAPEPFPFVPGTAREARILVLLLVPAGTSHQRLLAGLGRLLRRSEVAERLAAARSPEELLGLPAVSEPLVEEELQVGHVMSPGVAAVTPETSFGEVAGLMARRRLRAVPVVNEAREMMGIITDREVLEHFLPDVVAAGDVGGPADAFDVPVRDRMVRRVLCVRMDQSLREAVTMMVQKDVDSFPVVAEGALVGFLTRGDVIRRLLAPRPKSGGEPVRSSTLTPDEETDEGKGR